MSLSKFLDPKNDFAFKRIFGTEKNRDILIHFINDILGFEGPEQIQKVSFLKTTQDPEIASKKQSLVDVLCTDEAGRQYIIEMQVARTSGFEKRAQYYAAKAYSRQLERGDGYAHLKEVIFIAITDFVMFKDKPSYYSTHCLLDTETYSHDLKDFSFTFLELPKFHKTIDELTSIIEKWTYFFKHADETNEGELLKIAGEDRVIIRAYEELNRFSWTEIELNTYEQEEKRERDAQAILEQKLSDAEARGVEKGITEGEMKMLLSLLEYKFGPIPESYRRRLQQAESQELQRWSQEVLKAPTLEAVFK
jgi:predicted transposase/invertase (TIGR01784 family)